MALCKLLDDTGILTVKTFIVPSSHRPVSQFLQVVHFFFFFSMLIIIKADKSNYAHAEADEHLHPSHQIHTTLVSFILCWNEAWCGFFLSGLSNPSDVGKTLGQPFPVNPLLSKSSAGPSACPHLSPCKDLLGSCFPIYLRSWFWFVKGLI